MLKTHLIYTLLLFTLGACNAQQTPTKNIMDTAKNNNPIYSTTDTTKVVLKEDEWKNQRLNNIILLGKRHRTCLDKQV
jgi:hypothetical protein